MQLPDIEDVCALVHDAWMDAKRESDLPSRKTEQDEEMMVPYAELSESAKDLDRATV